VIDAIIVLATIVMAGNRANNPQRNVPRPLLEASRRYVSAVLAFSSQDIAVSALSASLLSAKLAVSVLNQFWIFDFGFKRDISDRSKNGLEFSFRLLNDLRFGWTGEISCANPTPAAFQG
jgi:hypothetical protein